MSFLLVALLLPLTQQVIASPAVEAAVAEKPVCRRVTTAGTRVARRICKTEAEWKAQDESRDLTRGVDGASQSVR